MALNEINTLFSNVIRIPYLWSVNSPKRSLMALLAFLVVGVPALKYLQGLVENIPYIPILTVTFAFLTSLELSIYLLLILFILIVSWLVYLSIVFLSTRNIRDKFGKELNHWAIPLNAGWTIQSCTDRLGMMLGVTNSAFPGTLKGAYSWYDYEISFLAKMDEKTPTDRQNFSFVVRSEDNYNGVMLQVTKTHIYPHLLYNSAYILDTEKNIHLPTILEAGCWIKVKVLVHGDNVDINLNGFSVSYNIPSLIIKYGRNDLLSKGSVTLSELQQVNTDVQNKYAKIDDIFMMKQSPAKQEAMKTVTSIFDEINKPNGGYTVSYSQILLEYQKGSVGFRESGAESAYFKDFKIKKL